MRLQIKQSKKPDGWILPDQSRLLRSAGSDNSITAVNSTSTVSPPPRIGHGCMWVEWNSSPSHTYYPLSVCHQKYISHSVWVIEIRTRRLWSFLGDLLSAASSATLVSSSIKRQLLPLISPSSLPHPPTHPQTHTHARTHAHSLDSR